jgi:hypothetical protein
MKARPWSRSIFGRFCGLLLLVVGSWSQGYPGPPEGVRCWRFSLRFLLAASFVCCLTSASESSPSVGIRPALLVRLEFVRKPYIRPGVGHEHSWIGLRIHPETCGAWSEVSRAGPNLDEGMWICGWR